ncbi:hypothetical protein [Hydrogenophaga atypica]|jgi:hypothetical protein|uniref:DUF1640 domain-containing protein n=1 Tax=Hydrogenophaga atypica TaxID=249409 RepID=A0ABW2QQ38_9BURK
MNMRVQLSMFEALTEIGVKPDAARKVERQMEAAIEAGQDAVRAEMYEQLATKADLAELRLATKADMAELKTELKADIAGVKVDISEMESRLLRAMNDQTWKLVTFVVVINGAMLGLFKLIG